MKYLLPLFLSAFYCGGLLTTGRLLWWYWTVGVQYGPKIALVAAGVAMTLGYFAFAVILPIVIVQEFREAKQRGV